jgi:hypothetical protein
VRAGVVEHALAIEGCEHVGDHEDGVRPVSIHGFEHAVEVIGLTHAERLHRDPEGLRRGGFTCRIFSG